MDGIKFPSIRQVTTYALSPSSEDIDKNIWNLDFVPSLAECESFIKVLTQMKGTMKTVHLNQIGVFGINQLLIIKRLHELRDIQREIYEEKTWFEKDVVCPSKVCPSLDKRILEQLQCKLLEYHNGKVVFYRYTLVRDIVSLCCNRWASLGLLQAFVQLLNKMRTSSRVIILNGIGNITEQQLRFYLQLDALKPNLDHLFILLNVGKDCKGETFVADCNRNGSHWALLDIDLKSKRYLYCDTLAWPLPRYLNNDIMPLLTALESICNKSVPKPGMRNPFIIRCAHLSENIDEFGKHHCRGRCLVNLPLQRCGNICGIISVFTAAIAVIYPRVWTVLKETQREVNHPALWFRMPSDHAEYMRKCLGRVLVDGEFRVGSFGIVPETIDSIEKQVDLLKDSSHRKQTSTEVKTPLNNLKLNEEGVGVLRARGKLKKALSRKHSYASQDEKSSQNNKSGDLIGRDNVARRNEGGDSIGRDNVARRNEGVLLNILFQKFAVNVSCSTKKSPQNNSILCIWLQLLSTGS